jgi:hypothetical protein
MAGTAAKKSKPKKPSRVAWLYKQLLIPQAQGIIRTQLLTEEQQRRAASKTGMNLVKMWAGFQGISETRAIVEIALFLELITSREAIQLRREITGRGGIDIPADKPRWDRSLCQLHVGDQLARKVRGLTVATNIVAILDAFQQHKWPSRIANPVPGDLDSQGMREAIASLNKKLKIIRFKADGTGKGITWERR